MSMNFHDQPGRWTEEDWKKYLPKDDAPVRPHVRRMRLDLHWLQITTYVVVILTCMLIVANLVAFDTYINDLVTQLERMYP